MTMIQPPHSVADASAPVAGQAIVSPGAVSPVTGIAFGAMVLTASGERAVETLVPGDRIITRDGIRRLRAAVTNEVSGTAIRVAPSALGHERPECEVVLAPGQFIYLRDWRAQALYGTPTALVPAARLVDGEYISEADIPALPVVTLLFDAPCVIYAAGLELACTTG